MKNVLLGGLAALIVIGTPVVASATDMHPPCLEGETCGASGNDASLAPDERPRPLGDMEADPLGLLWDEGPVFDEEIIEKDGYVLV